MRLLYTGFPLHATRDTLVRAFSSPCPGRAILWAASIIFYVCVLTSVFLANIAGHGFILFLLRFCAILDRQSFRLTPVYNTALCYDVWCRILGRNRRLDAHLSIRFGQEQIPAERARRAAEGEGDPDFQAPFCWRDNKTISWSGRVSDPIVDDAWTHVVRSFSPSSDRYGSGVCTAELTLLLEFTQDCSRGRSSRHHQANGTQYGR